MVVVNGGATVAYTKRTVTEVEWLDTGQVPHEGTCSIVGVGTDETA